LLEPPEPPVLSKSAEAAGFALRHLSEVGSTNTVAKEALSEGADRLWIVADVQTAGRGRHARGWVSPAGNLHASLALADPCPQHAMPLMGFVAGVALARAVRSLAPHLGLRACLKWPNDLLIEGAKASGILLEAAPASGGRQGLVIGMGVNVVEAPDGLDQPATALALHAPDATRAALFSALSAEMAEALALFDRGKGFPALREAWLDLALPRGQAMRVRLPAGTLEGRFAGIDATGALLLDTAAGRQSILAGDVFAL
jgi:BirA family biotin operon repressor/biotin-[acetyl-CoA-carboxylase] ligase